MTTTYKPYPAYKDSGVEWLGEIPEGWEAWKLNHFTPIITCGVASTPEYTDDGVIFLSAQNVKNQKIDLSKGHKFISHQKHDELTRNRRPQNGDILLSRVGTVGEVCTVNVDFDFSIFVSLTHLRLLKSVCKNEFFVFLFQSNYVKQLHKAVTLVGGGVGNLNVNDLRVYKLPIPSIKEQTQIANFLDHETARIDTLIAKQKKLIALLKEKRQAVISHAVTKGLNPDVEMKDSGVEWLGEVPAHWGISRLKNVAKIIDCRNKTPEYFDDGEYFVVRTTNVRHQKLNFEGALYTNFDNFKIWTQRGIPPEGSILFTREAPAGEVCIVPHNLNFCMGQRMMNFIPDNKNYTKYLFDFLISDCLNRYINSVSHGSTVSHLRVEQVQNIPVLVPPDSEVFIIHDYIKKLKTNFDNLALKAQEAIDLMKERRTALISAAVTGKIDLRDWQAPQEQSAKVLVEQEA